MASRQATLTLYVPRVYRRGFGGGRGLGAVASSPAVATIASAIQTQEGYYPGSLAYRNNNPGNLMYVGQAGATAGANGLAVFPTYDMGLQALYDQIDRYAARGMTIEDMTNVYAPASVPGNNPVIYATNISTALGVSPNTPLASLALSAPAGGSGAAGDMVDFSPADSVLSDIGLPDLSTLDPGMVAAGAIAVGLALYLVFR